VAVDVHQVLAVLREREPIFHGPAWPTTRPELDQLVADEFWEVGASGAVYDRELVLQSVAARSVDPMDETWIASDFACQAVGHTYLRTDVLAATGGTAQSPPDDMAANGGRLAGGLPPRHARRQVAREGAVTNSRIEPPSHCHLPRGLSGCLLGHSLRRQKNDKRADDAQRFAACTSSNS
jgi:hypothetical protein